MKVPEFIEEIVYGTMPAKPTFEPTTRKPMSRKHKLRLSKRLREQLK